MALTAGLSLLSHELPSTLATEAEDILIVYFSIHNASVPHQEEGRSELREQRGGPAEDPLATCPGAGAWLAGHRAAPARTVCGRLLPLIRAQWWLQGLGSHTRQSPSSDEEDREICLSRRPTCRLKEHLPSR